MCKLHLHVYCSYMCVLQLLQLHMHVCISLSKNIEENNVPLSVPEKYQKLLIKTSVAHIISAFSTYSFRSNESIVCCHFLGVVQPISPTLIEMRHRPTSHN